MLLGDKGLGEVGYCEAVVAVLSSILSGYGGALDKRNLYLIQDLHTKAVKNYIAACLKREKEPVGG